MHQSILLKPFPPLPEPLEHSGNSMQPVPGFNTYLTMCWPWMQWNFVFDSIAFHLQHITQRYKTLKRRGWQTGVYRPNKKSASAVLKTV